MANQTYPHGLVPVTRNGESPDTVAYPKSTSSAEALWVNSPVYLTSGEVRSVVTDADGMGMTAAANGMTGVVVALLDSNKIPVNTLAAGAAGTVVMTYLKDQVYRACVDDTAFVDADAANKYYNLTAETTTQQAFSGRKIDGSTEATSATSDATTASGVIFVGKRVPHVGTINATATANTEVYCTINPNFHVAAA